MQSMRMIPVAAAALACAGCVVPQQRYDDLNSEKAVLEAKCADLTREREKLAAEKASTDALIARGEREIAKFEQRVKDLRESNIEMMREIKDSRARSAEFEKKVGEAAASQARAEEEKKSLERKCERIEKERVTIQRQYRAILEQDAQLQRRLSEMGQNRPEAPAPTPTGQGLDVSGGG